MLKMNSNFKISPAIIGGAAFIALGGITAAQAEPSLQVDILSLTTTYDNVNDDVVTQNSQFTLRLLGGAGTGKAVTLNTEYRMSVALTPKTGPSSSNLGSFLLNGTEIDVTADMTFGTPPIELFANNETLPSHDIFETFFIERSFQWDPLDLTQINNVENNPGDSTGACDPNFESCLFFLDFSVDVTNLSPDVELHFDLYEPTFDAISGEIEGISSKAPFSHDASTNGRVPPPPGGGIPEPTTIALFGMGLIGLGMLRRRRRRS